MVSISSPAYPQRYSNSITCVWHVEAAAEFRIGEFQQRAINKLFRRPTSLFFLQVSENNDNLL